MRWWHSVSAMAEFYVQISEEETSDGIVFESEEYQAMVDGGTLTDETREFASSLFGARSSARRS